MRWAKLQKNECQVMPYPNPADLDAIRKDPNVVVLEQPGLNIGYLAYNTTKKPFDDVRVRKAINMAINKKAIIEAVFLATGIPAINPIPPTMWSYNKTHQGRPLRSGGGQEAARRSRLSERLRHRPVGDAGAAPVQPERQAHRRTDAGRPRQDRRQGRDQELEWGEYRKRAQAGEHQMAQLGWTGDNGDPDNFLNTLLGCDSAKTNGSNIAKFCYQPFEDLVQKAKTRQRSSPSAPSSMNRRR